MIGGGYGIRANYCCVIRANIYNELMQARYTTTDGRGEQEMTTMMISAMAVRAAKNRRVWGRYATMRYLAKRGVPVRLYQIAVACEATANGKFLEVES